MSEKSDDEHKVGPGRPPRNTRWQKGCKSPNPKGRPRKDRSSGPDLKKALEQALNEKVSVHRGDRTVSMTKGEVGIQQLVNQYIAGDPRARRDVMEIADKLGIDIWAKHRSTIEEALATKDQEILDAYVKRHSGTKDLAPAEPVLAPPELLDDDVAADDSGEPEPTLPSRSKPEIKSKSDPEPSGNEKQAAPPLDQASLGRGSPPPGGFSLTTRKWS